MFSKTNWKQRAARAAAFLCVAAPLAARAEGDFDASTVISGMGTKLTALGAAGLVLLGITVAILIGMKFTKKTVNKAT